MAVKVIGLDTAKHIFKIHDADSGSHGFERVTEAAIHTDVA